jgi:hypothetical protein
VQLAVLFCTTSWCQAGLRRGFVETCGVIVKKFARTDGYTAVFKELLPQLKIRRRKQLKVEKRTKHILKIFAIDLDFWIFNFSRKHCNVSLNSHWEQNCDKEEKGESYY